MERQYPSGRRYATVPEILAADDRIWAGHARLLIEAIIRCHEVGSRLHVEADIDMRIRYQNELPPSYAIEQTIENVRLIAEQLFPDWAQEKREEEERRRLNHLEWKSRQKKGIPGKLRKAVLERDAYRCQFCGDHRDLCVDHKIPEARGGPTTLENLQTLCKPCNSRKCARVAPHPLALPVAERGATSQDP